MHHARPVPSSSASSSTTTAPPATTPRPARSSSSASPPTASFSPDCNAPDGNGAILFFVHRRPHEFVTTFPLSCRLSSRPPNRTRSPGLVSRQRPAQPGDDTPPYSTAARSGGSKGPTADVSCLREAPSTVREKCRPRSPPLGCVRRRERRDGSPAPTCGTQRGDQARSTVRISLAAHNRCRCSACYSRGLTLPRSLKLCRGWTPLRIWLATNPPARPPPHSDERNGRRSVATCGVAFSGASHRPHSSGAALPGVSLADRSPRRVPGHYAPLRSRALLSSNHGVSRRQAGAATYGRFSVRPLGPLRV